MARGSVETAGEARARSQQYIEGEAHRSVVEFDLVSKSTGTVTYRSDELDRLTEACWSSTSCPGGPPATPLACIACIGGLLSRPAATINPPAGETYRQYTYDPVGNRLTEVPDAGTTAYAYDAADRLTSVTAPGGGVTRYAFDANGNQTVAGASTFSYDLADRLTSATVATTTETYTWSGDGVRLSATSGNGPSATTRFLVDRAFDLPTVVAERDGNGKLLRRYAYGLDLLSQTTPNKGPYWSHHDGLGSVTDVTSSAGTSLWWAEYTPFGAPRASGSTSQALVNLFRFTGAYLDLVTALYHLRARQYDPSSGRFLSPDPVSPSLSSPSVGAYVYVRNNPANLVDPSGRESLPVGATNPAGCVAGLAGFTALAEISGVVALAGASLQGFSITILGFSVGTTGPVTLSSFFAGLLLEGIGMAGEAAAGYALYETCIQSGS